MILLLITVLFAVRLNATAWSYKQTEFFNIHYKTDFKSKGVQILLQQADKELKQIERFFGYRIGGQLELVVQEAGNPYTVLRQKEVAYANRLQGGYVALPKPPITLYYNGNDHLLRSNLRRQITHMLLNEMLMGGNLSEKIKLETIMNIPPWFISGLCDFMAEGWTTQDEDQMRELFEGKKEISWNSVPLQYQKVLNKSIWHFIHQTKSHEHLVHFIYIAKKSHKVEIATMYAFDQSYVELRNAWQEFYGTAYFVDIARVLPRRPEDIIKWKPGDKVLDIANNNGHILMAVKKRSQLCFYAINEANSHQITEVFKTKLPELIEQHHSILPEMVVVKAVNDGFEVVINGTEEPRWFSYNPGLGWKTIPPPVSLAWVYDFDKTNDDFWVAGFNDGQQYLMEQNKVVKSGTYIPEICAVNGGLAYLNQPHFSQLQLQDPGDVNTTLHFYLADLTTLRDSGKIQNLSAYKGQLLYSKNSNGIYNDYVLNLNSNEGAFLTDYKRNIYLHSWDEKANILLEVMFLNNNYQYFVTPIEPEVSLFNQALDKEPRPTYFVKRTLDFGRFHDDRSYVSSRKLGSLKTKTNPETDTVNQGEINYPYTFQTPFPKAYYNQFKYDSLILTNERVDTGYRSWEYTNVFYGRKVEVRFDNSRFPLQELSGFLPEKEVLSYRLIPYLGIRFDEMMGGYSFDGALRFNGNFSISDLYLSYGRNKNDWQYKVNLLRKSRLFNIDNLAYYRTKTHYLSFDLVRKFSPHLSVGIQPFFRSDKSVPASSDLDLLTEPKRQMQYLGFNWEAKFDNLKRVKTNIFNGLRVQFNFKQYHSILASDRKGSMYNTSLLVNYEKALTPFLGWKTDFDFYMSNGDFTTYYYSGGTQNWLFSRWDEGKPLEGYNNPAMMQNGAMIRGFDINAQYGNKSLALTEELNLRLMDWWRRSSTTGSWLSEFTLAAFTDLGMTWFEDKPFSPGNPEFVDYVNSATLKIKNYRSGMPLLFGAGWGIRTQVYDYYLKYDVAWGWREYNWHDSKQYLSIGLQF